jgi:hypothetical protein
LLGIKEGKASVYYLKEDLHEVQRETEVNKMDVRCTGYGESRNRVMKFE